MKASLHAGNGEIKDEKLKKLAYIDRLRSNSKQVTVSNSDRVYKIILTPTGYRNSLINGNKENELAYFRRGGEILSPWEKGTSVKPIFGYEDEPVGALGNSWVNRLGSSDNLPLQRPTPGDEDDDF